MLWMPHNRDHLLAIDVGTQSVRALLVDPRGRLVARSRVPIEPYVSPRPGWAEQDPELYWSKLCEACRQLWATSPIPREAIAAVGLTTQRGTVVVTDRDGAPLRPAIIWLDQRRATALPSLGPWAALFRLAGASEILAHFMAEAEINWLRQHQPQTIDRIGRYLLLSGFLTHRMTGRFADSVGCQVGYVPFDFKRQRWASRWDWKWRAIPLRSEWLPELVPPGETLGAVSRAAAEATGIPEGLPLVAAAADKACEVLGSGALEPEVGCLSYGTSATLNTIHQRYVEAVRLVPPFPAAVPGAYAVEIQIYRGFWMVSWFKQEFGLREMQIAAERGIEPEALFDELVREVPPGSQGLVLQPFWSPGVRVPGPEAKGAIVGFGDVHTRAHIYRAILEGLAYALREGKERTERRTKTPIREIRVAGGGSQSDEAMQITADVFGLPASRPHVFEASGLGAAIDAAVGCGLHPDFSTAVQEMTRVTETFEPRADVAATYDALYRDVYSRLYPRLKPLYESIRRITGYPQRPGS